MVVSYDDLFDREFGENAIDVIKAIIATADQMLSERDTLGTMFEIHTKDIEHVRGSKWEPDEWLFNECLTKCFKDEDCSECFKCLKKTKGDRSKCANPDCFECDDCMAACPKEFSSKRYV